MQDGHFSGVPLESDPEIFNTVLRGLGVHSLECRDVLSVHTEDLLPGADLALPTPVYALILLYNATEEYEAGIRAARQKERDEGRGYAGRGEDEPVLWFEQKIRHACGFFALLHAVANLPERDKFIAPDSLLANLLATTIPLEPTERADALKASAALAQVYNPASQRGSTPITEEVRGHYVCFVPSPKNGHIYELDGGKNGPVDHDALLGGDRDTLSGGMKLVRDFIRDNLDPQNPGFHVLALVANE
ncbi:ubiquitin C-terminal hydrolase L3 [Roridomyces roridus]|uniref:Ubiquitin carboxyl-terminal hydrolase n=1 Tax=Roridomyces roridus TaxID=1738132 RepID=A0AAD7BRN4_9AGAR|nr:ubiquitin C-terminal hydrolase L3 [Roridomyces roridus]